MPELPEIETVKLQLQKVLVGQICLRVEKKELEEIEGKEVLGIKRLGKVLLINFGPNLDLGFHFKMTGQLIYEPKTPKLKNSKTQMPNKHTRAIFHLSGGILYFNDMRKFGWVRINPEFPSTLGEDALKIGAPKFLKILKLLKKPIKCAIMDQEVIAGVGNIYANDALWEAGIDPRVTSDKVTSDRAELLLKKIKLVLREGIKYGGASVSDYVNSHGVGGTYQDHMRVYKKEKTPCLRCKTLIIKIVLGGRGTYYCPKCQYHPSPMLHRGFPS